MSLEASTGTFWELSREAEQQIRGEAAGAPVPTLTALAELREVEPAAAPLQRAIDGTMERIVAHAREGQRADLARLRAEAGGLPYRSADPVWYRWTPQAPWVMATISHFDRHAELWCIRLVRSELVTYADEAGLRPRAEGEIAPGRRSFGP